MVIVGLPASLWRWTSGVQGAGVDHLGRARYALDLLEKDLVGYAGWSAVLLPPSLQSIATKDGVLCHSAGDRIRFRCVVPVGHEFSVAEVTYGLFPSESCPDSAFFPGERRGNPYTLVRHVRLLDPSLRFEIYPTGRRFDEADEILCGAVGFDMGRIGWDDSGPCQNGATRSAGGVERMTSADGLSLRVTLVVREAQGQERTLRIHISLPTPVCSVIPWACSFMTYRLR